VKGVPITWEDSLKYLDYVKTHGIQQFLETWHRVKDFSQDELKWGDEIECGIFVINAKSKSIKLQLRGAELLELLQQNELKVMHQSEGCTWHPEFGTWMIESTPSRPYSNYATDLLRVERNMILRRRRLLASLQPNEIAPTVTCFPLLGISNTISTNETFTAPFSTSQYVPDIVINPHPRFGALVRNIRARRGSKVDIKIPLFKDLLTPEYLEESQRKSILEIMKRDGHMTEETDSNIHMDCMAFGMGMCCLQVTLQACDVNESRYIYDQLAVLAPIMLALTASSPIYKGRLADIDVRWTVIAQSVDDRTAAERGEVPEEDLPSFAAEHSQYAGQGVRRQSKSRYDSISTYIYHCNNCELCERSFEYYNDVPCPVDEEIKSRLLAGGIDGNLSHHLAHLFTRDPLVIFEGEIESDDAASMDHFENIQSTNWQSVRWKPPPIRKTLEDPHIGWRVELRTMEVQLTDFCNAAFTVFTALVTRVILAFDLGLYIPLSKVDENMRRAHLNDAARTQKFFFREFMGPPDMEESSASRAVEEWNDSYANEESFNQAPWKKYLKTEHAFEEMSLSEIFNGKDGYYPGLVPLVYAYLSYIDCDPEAFHRVDEYLQFISRRASGELLTPAQWMRKFVTSHPKYRKDSVVSEEIAYDLMIACKEIGEGTRACPELLGDVKITKIHAGHPYDTQLAGKLSSADRSSLIQRLLQRGDQVRQRRESEAEEKKIPLMRAHSIS